MHSVTRSRATGCTSVLPLLLLLVVALLVTTAHARNMTEMTTFAQISRILRSDTDPHLLYLYDPLDLNSVRFMPHVDEAAFLLEGFVAVHAVNVRAPQLQWLMNAWNVQVLPSLRLLPASPPTSSRKPYASPAATKTPQEYGSMDYHPESIRKFALQAIPSASGLIDRFDVESRAAALQQLAVTGTTVPVVMLFTDKTTTSQLYRRLAQKYAQRLAFVEIVAAKCPKTQQAFYVQTLPSLLVIPSAANGGAGSTMTKRVVYDGKFAVTDLAAFLDKFAATSVEQREENARQEQQAAIDKELRSRQGPTA